MFIDGDDLLQISEQGRQPAPELTRRKRHTKRWNELEVVMSFVRMLSDDPRVPTQ